MLGHHPFCCKKLEFPYFILYTGVNTVPLDFQTFVIDRIVTVPSSTYASFYIIIYRPTS